MGRGAGRAVRLLPAWSDDVRGGVTGHEPQSKRCGYRRRALGQHLPVRNLREDSQGDPPGRGRNARNKPMKAAFILSVYATLAFAQSIAKDDGVSAFREVASV